MKIYRADGTWYTNNLPDDDFGWYLDNIIIDESVPDYEDQNKSTFSYNCEAIEVHEAASVDINLIFEKIEACLEKLYKKVPKKSHILNLINPCTVESKMLLSVVHYAMYEHFSPSMIKLEHFRGGSHLKYCENIDDLVYDGILNYYQHKNSNGLSLLMDLILTETKCDVSELSLDNKLHNLNDFDCDEIYRNKEKNVSFCDQDLERCGMTEIVRNVQEMCFQTNDMHEEISEMKNSCVLETLRVDCLIKIAETLEKDLRETKFMDDLIHLLEGNLDEVLLKKSPFRIFLPSSQQQNMNLII